MTSKKYLIISGVLLSVIILHLINPIRLFSRSGLCHDDPTVFVQGSFGVFSPNEDKVYVLVNPNYYRPAVGICAFPDGGISIVLHNSIDVYELDLQTKQTRQLSSIDEHEFDNFIIGGGSSVITVTHKDNHKFYAMITGQDGFTLYPKRCCWR